MMEIVEKDHLKVAKAREKYCRGSVVMVRTQIGSLKFEGLRKLEFQNTYYIIHRFYKDESKKSLSIRKIVKKLSRLSQLISLLSLKSLLSGLFFA